jgi:S1-C subfamily serine protease
MKKLSIYSIALLFLLTICVSLAPTVTAVLPSCVSICVSDGATTTTPIGGGVIVAPGYVVTAQHVTDFLKTQGLDVYVKFADGCLCKATKVIPLQSDAKTPIDAALVRVDTKNSPAARFGSPHPIQQGAEVFAVGAPFGLEQSVTVGVISALSRNLTVETMNYTNVIQTSGLLHPGNSGGPLFDRWGYVLGINVVGEGTDGGIGFTVPISQVQIGMKRVGL